MLTLTAMSSRAKKRPAILDGFEIQKNKKGRAVYAMRSYKKGEFVYRLGGKETRPHSLGYHLQDFKNASNNPLQVGPITYIELNIPSLYFNHSCDPNLGVRNRSDLYALRAIKKRGELTYDYTTTIDESFECICGSRKCRKAIGDFFTLPRSIQSSYYKRNALPAHIRRKFARLNRSS